MAAFHFLETTQWGEKEIGLNSSRQNYSIWLGKASLAVLALISKKLK